MAAGQAGSQPHTHVNRLCNMSFLSLQTLKPGYTTRQHTVSADQFTYSQTVRTLIHVDIATSFLIRRKLLQDTIGRPILIGVSPKIN